MFHFKVNFEFEFEEIGVGCCVFLVLLEVFLDSSRLGARVKSFDGKKQELGNTTFMMHQG